MYQRFSAARLKNGQTMEVGVLLAPDGKYKEGIITLLKHKGGNWNWHIERSLSERLGDLETRYHIGLLSDEPVANAMTVEYRGTGILGHVFTRPEHRRKGACTAILKELIKHFRERGGRLLYLGTGFESPAYWIYHRFGFRSLTERSGLMKCEAVPNAESELFTPTTAKVADVQWRHWPMMMALALSREGDYLRSLSHQHFGFSSFEGAFLDLKRSTETEPNRSRCKLLEKSSRIVVGYAIVRPNPHWLGSANILEFFVHPNFSQQGAELLSALDLPPGKTQCFADHMSTQKIETLKKCGFRLEATLKGQIVRDSRRLDVKIYSKWAN